MHTGTVKALQQLTKYKHSLSCITQQGVLNLSVPPHGTWVLNKQGPNKQIWWSSPVSGPKRFEWQPADADNAVIEGQWVNTRDGASMTALLTQELHSKVKLDVDLSDS
jgi:frataxin